MVGYLIFPKFKFIGSLNLSTGDKNSQVFSLKDRFVLLIFKKYLPNKSSLNNHGLSVIYSSINCVS